MGLGPDHNATAMSATAWPGVYAGVGHHPLSSGPPDIGELEKLARRDRVVAIGEVGLDVTSSAPMEAQKEWFDAMCGLAVKLNLPVSIHCRDAGQEVLDVVSRHRGLTGAMHYFSLDWEWAEKFLAAGLHISFGALIMRATREALRDVVRRVPADRLLLETDAPYGVLKSHPGEQMRPAWILEAAEAVANLRGVSLDDLCAQELDNARKLFHLP